nr:hypothetical protein [Altererythrobacter segetis]
MSTRLLIAYFLIVLLACGVAAAIWRLHYNSERQRLKRYYRSEHERSKH